MSQAPIQQQYNEEKQDRAGMKGDKSEQSVIIRTYPNTVYLWPTAAVSFIIYLIDYIYTHFMTQNIFDDPGAQATAAGAFFISFFIVLIIMSFDFSLGKSFSIFITFIVFVILYYFVIDKFMPEELSINQVLITIDIGAKANFYMLYTIILLVLFFFVYVSHHFNYWEISPNRIKHHKGLLEREENFSAHNSRVVTKIDEDKFETLDIPEFVFVPLIGKEGWNQK